MFVDKSQRKFDYRDQIPALQDFSSTADDLIDANDPSSLFACCKPLERLLASDWFEQLVSSELDLMARFPQHSSGGLSESRMSLLSTDQMVLNLIAMPQSRAGVSRQLFGALHSAVVGVVGASEVQIRRFFQARPFPVDVLDRSRRLEDRGIQTVLAGQVATISAGHDVIDISAAAGPTVMLWLQARETARLFWRYDSATLMPQALVSDVGDVGRLEFAAAVLARMGDVRNAPALQKLYWHPDHVVRWAAVRALMKLDRAAGLELLEAALSDPHPHVRQAARTGLDRLTPAPMDVAQAA
jgi:hypothetical protein